MTKKSNDIYFAVITAFDTKEQAEFVQREIKIELGYNSWVREKLHSEDVD